MAISSDWKPLTLVAVVAVAVIADCWLTINIKKQEQQQQTKAEKQDREENNNNNATKKKQQK